MDKEKLEAEIKQAILDIDGQTDSTEDENYIKSEKQKKKNKRTKKAIIIAACIIAVIALVILGWYLIERHANAWALKTDTLYVEYGVPYYPSIDDIIDTEKYSNVNSSNTELLFDTSEEANKETEEIEDSLSYQEKGTYALYVNHHSYYKIFKKTVFSAETTGMVTVVVQDTAAPVFDENCPTEIEVQKDSEIGNLNEIFTVEDFSDFELSIDETAYDISAPGEYKTQVIAEDSDGNQSALDISIIVTDADAGIDTVAEENSNAENDSADEAVSNAEETSDID